MKFKYQAKNKNGELQVGYVDGIDRDAAAALLSSHELYVMSLVAEAAPGLAQQFAGYFTRVRQKDLVVFARQLATLLDARLSLSDALKILRAQTANPTLREAVMQISNDIDAGLSFSQAIERQGNIFPDYYMEMVRAAEVTGNLNETATFLADYTEKESDLRSRISSALVYPIIVLILFAVVAFIMLTFVYPSLGTVFQQNQVPLPWYTATLLSLGLFLETWWPAVLIGVLVVVAVIIDYSQTKEGGVVMDELKISVPIAKNVFVPVVLARFGNAAALLVHGGIPIAQALEILSRMLGNTLYRDVVHSIADDVRQGLLLSQGIAKHPQFFPPLVSQMVAVGETSGKVEDMFGRIAGIYTREADQVTGNLVELIQPVLMIGMGLLVGLLFASILIPIYNLTTSIH